MKIKIKTIEVTLGDYTFHPELSPIEHATLTLARGNAIKKAWTPLVGALVATNTLPEGIEGIIGKWARGFHLGYRSKKADTLARKKLKSLIEEQLKEARYNPKEARESGLIDRTMEKRIGEVHNDWAMVLLQAQTELPPEDQLDPLPVTQEELNKLLSEGNPSS